MAIALSPANAEGDRHRVDIPSLDLSEAVARLSRELGVSIGTDGTLPHIRSRAVQGVLSVGDALDGLLSGTGYRARRAGPTAWRIERAPPQAVADSRPESRPAQLTQAIGEPIIVTAGKRNSRLLDLPMSVSAVDLSEGGRIGQRGTGYTADVVSEIDGMTLTASGAGRSRLFLRGIADSPFNGESQSTVAVMLDDARLTYAAPDPDIALFDMERAEVIKGPQGALYGTGALGGIYHLVTRKAGLENTAFALSAGTEALAGGGVGYDAAAVANLPFKPGVAAVRFVGYSRLQPGWIDTGGRPDSNSSQLLGARLGLGVDPGGGWRFDLTGFGQWLESRDSQYVYRVGARSRPAQIAEPHDNDLRHLSLRLVRERGGANIVLSSAMTWHEVNDTYDATHAAESFGLANPQTLEVARTYRVWDNEARISITTGKLRWLAGISAVEARQHDAWVLFAAPSGELAIDDDSRVTRDLSAFGDVSLPFGSGFSVEAGARLFHSSVSETRMLPSGPASSDLGRTGLTPSFAFSWRPDSQRLFFLRYGSAIREGGLDITASGDLERLKGDELETFEAGWRQQISVAGRLELGAYFTRWQNMQSDMLQATGLIETENAGNAEIVGLEAGLTLPIDEAWLVSMGGSLQEARLVRNDLGIELENRRLPVVPEYVLRGALEYSFALGHANATLRMKLRYVGPARLSFDPVVDHPIGDYIESSLEGRIDFGAFLLSLGFDNLFGSSADQLAYGNPLRFAQFRQYTPQRPRGLTIGLHTAF